MPTRNIFPTREATQGYADWEVGYAKCFHNNFPKNDTAQLMFKVPLGWDIYQPLHMGWPASLSLQPVGCFREWEHLERTSHPWLHAQRSRWLHQDHFSANMQFVCNIRNICTCAYRNAYAMFIHTHIMCIYVNVYVYILYILWIICLYVCIVYSRMRTEHA